MPRLLNEALSKYSHEADVDGNGRVSILEAFNHVSEHPHVVCSLGMDHFQYDDNGDGISHMDPLPNGGDGSLGATIYLVQIPPVMDLDQDDSAGEDQGNYAVRFTEGGEPVPIADRDATVTDPDSTHLAALTATVTNLQDPLCEWLDADVTGTSIAKSYDTRGCLRSRASTPWSNISGRCDRLPIRIPRAIRTRRIVTSRSC
jgi:hypothetical protein